MTNQVLAQTSVARRFDSTLRVKDGDDRSMWERIFSEICRSSCVESRAVCSVSTVSPCPVCTNLRATEPAACSGVWWCGVPVQYSYSG